MVYHSNQQFRITRIDPIPIRRPLSPPSQDWRHWHRSKSTSALLSVLAFLLLGSSIVPSSSCSSLSPPSKREISNEAPSSISPGSSAHDHLPTLRDNSSDISPADYACQPIGPCQPCPLDELSNPVCETYHNRRLVDCIYLGNSSSTPLAPIPASNSSLNATDAPPHQNGIGAGLGAAEFQTWEACERVVLQERRDFYEFVMCNLFIAALSLIIYGLRTKQLVIRQYGNLAARIGILPS